MTEIVTSHQYETVTFDSLLLSHAAEFSVLLPQKLKQERELLHQSCLTPNQLLDAISDHLDRCGRFYYSSQAIQNSDRRLEISQALLLYAANLWYEAKNYQTCLSTLFVLREDIVHSRDLSRSHTVTELIEKITEEYAASDFAKHM